MSCTDEFAGDYLLAEQAFEEQLLQDKCWMTRDGRGLKISDMTESHTANTIAFLKRTNPESPFLPLLEEHIFTTQEKMMDDKTIEKIAAQLGSTAEHLWGVLIHQAPICGAIDMFISVAMLCATVVGFRFVRDKTTVPKRTEDDPYPHAEWEEGLLAWLVLALWVFATTVTTVDAVRTVITVSFNPEYWAPHQILSALK